MHFYQQTGLIVMNKHVKYYVWSVALYGTTIWTLWEIIDQKYLENFETWCFSYRILDKFTRRAKPIRIIGDPDNQRPDKWSFSVR